MQAIDGVVGGGGGGVFVPLLPHQRHAPRRPKTHKKQVRNGLRLILSCPHHTLIVSQRVMLSNDRKAI